MCGWGVAPVLLHFINDWFKYFIVLFYIGNRPEVLICARKDSLEIL